MEAGDSSGRAVRVLWCESRRVRGQHALRPVRDGSITLEAEATAPRQGWPSWGGCEGERNR